jgi:hypothetical protein
VKSTGASLEGLETMLVKSFGHRLTVSAVVNRSGTLYPTGLQIVLQDISF